MATKDKFRESRIFPDTLSGLRKAERYESSLYKKYDFVIVKVLPSGIIRVEGHKKSRF